MVAVGPARPLIDFGTELVICRVIARFKSLILWQGRSDYDRIGKERGRAMTVSRALVFATFMVAAPFAAYGQFGGMPGMPGAPGGMPGGGGFGGPPAGPPPACRELLAMRDEVQKHGTAIQKANERKATVQEACKLFRNFLGAEAKFIKSLEDNTRACGVPPDAIKQAKDGHSKASVIGKQVCDAAAQGPRPAGPSLSDALGAGPLMPESSKSSSGGAFDTLNGNILSR
jgi:hypothetical protein